METIFGNTADFQTFFIAVLQIGIQSNDIHFCSTLTLVIYFFCEETDM